MEQLLLLRGVLEVSKLACPSAPRAVSQRSFDEARAASGNPHLPAARNIASSLGMPWVDVLHLAHEPERAHSFLLGRKQTSEEQDWLGDEYVIFVLHLVARRLGRDTLSLRDYSMECDRMLRGDRARWLHGGQLVLPNEEQIITHVGSWEAALRLAGMEPSHRATGNARRGRRSIPTLCDLLERFYEHHEAQPSLKDLTAFARGNGIPYPSERRERFGAAMAAWKADRRARGLPVPEKLPPRRARAEARVNYSRDVGAAREGERPLKRWEDTEECVAWMVRYLEGLPAGARSTRRAYRDWTLRQDGAPAPNTLAQHGGFERIRRLAQERIRAARRPARD